MNWIKITSESGLEDIPLNHEILLVDMRMEYHEADGVPRIFFKGYRDEYNNGQLSVEGYAPNDLQAYTHYMIITPPKD